MATNSREIDASVEAVWAVLADGEAYSDWVVGSRCVRGVDGDWPATGACIHHSVGVGPLSRNDVTEAVEVEAPRRLVLEAHLRPLATARVQMGLEVSDGGTLVTMEERFVRGPLSHLPLRLQDLLLGLRNVESLRRLRRLAERADARVALSGSR